MNKNSLYPLTIVAMVFIYTFLVRIQWLGGFDSGLHTWLTGSSVKFSQMWFYEGPVKLNFSMIENYPAIEFADIKERVPYVSYPPGTNLLIYLTSKILNMPPSHGMIEILNMSQQFFIAVLLTMILMHFISEKDWWSRLLCSVPGILYLIIPDLFYFHQKVYFSDQAILLPFVITLYYRLVKDEKYSIRVFFIFLYMFWVDYFTVSIALIFWLYDLFCEKSWKLAFNRTLFYLIPFVTMFMFMYWQLYHYDMFGELYMTFMQRTGRSDQGIILNMWKAFGHLGSKKYLFILVVCALIYQYRFYISERTRIIKLVFFVFLPVFLHTFLLSNHSRIHSFSVMKWYVVLVMILPYVVYIYVNSIKIQHLKYLKSLFIILLISFCGNHIAKIDRNNIKNNYMQTISTLFKQFDHSDILFSNNFIIPDNPPVKLSFSHKRVYPISMIGEIENKLKRRNVNSYSRVVLQDDFSFEKVEVQL